LVARSGFTYEQYELLERNERGARDEAPSEWSDNNELGVWGTAPKNFFGKIAARQTKKRGCHSGRFCFEPFGIMTGQ